MKKVLLLFIMVSLLGVNLACSKKEVSMSLRENQSNQELELITQDSSSFRQIGLDNSVDILKLCEENKNNTDSKNFLFLNEIIGKKFVYNKCHYYPIKYKLGSEYITKGAIVLITTPEKYSIVVFIESNGNNDIEQWIYKSFFVIQHDESTVLWDKNLEKESNDKETILGLYLYKKGTYLMAEGIYKPSYIIKIDNYNGSFIVTEDFTESYMMINDL